MKKIYFLLLLVSSLSLAQIDALNDNLPSVNGFVGNSNAGNVLADNGSGADKLNGVPTNLTEVAISVVTPAYPIFPGSPVPYLNPSTGIVGVSPGTPAGYYTLVYQICEIANPSNCDSAVVSIYIGAAMINAVDNVYNTMPNPNVGNVLNNDTLNGVPVLMYQITLSVVSPATPLNNGAAVPELNPYTGTIVVPGNTPNGTYTITYQICENLNPTNCDTAVVTITVVNNLLLSVTSTYNDYNNDGFVNVGDVINYQYSLTNTASSAITGISLSSPTVTISGGTLATLNAGQTNTSTFTGTHVITQNEINTHTVISTVTATGTLSGNNFMASTGNTLNLPITDGLLLNAFFDANNNGVQDSGENSIGTYSNYVYAINGGAYNYITAYPSTGVYLYETNPTNTYSLGFQLYNTYYFTCTTTYSNVTVPTGSGITTYNFPVQYNPFTDLGIYLYDTSSPPRPGFHYTSVVQIQNNGTQTIASGTVTFTKDVNVSITNVSQTVTTTPTGFTYTFTNLAPFESRFLYVTMLVPTIPTVALGQQLTHSVSTTIPSGDINVSNNSDTLTQTIVGSYDPNDKQESHGGQIVYETFTSNDYLTYTIRFENTGTANAINVKVNDLLDSKLDEASIRMVSASHAYVLERSGSQLTWKFNGINLPPSNGSPTVGHGSIVFQIKPKAGYAAGDIIPNTANIYFDFNPAIVTNTTTTAFVSPLATNETVFSNLNYFPNPTKNSITISNDTVIDAIEITSIVGQKMLAKKVNEWLTTIDLSSLAEGIYFVKLTAEGKEKTIKIVKE